MRVIDAVLEKNTLYSTGAPSINLEYGGQMGFMPRIGTLGPDGRSYEEWMSNQAYIRRNVIPILLTYPKFFDYMPNSQSWVRVLKAMMERHPIRIEGLNQSITIETDQHPVGGAGEMQDEYTNVNRTPSTPSFVWQELGGEPVERFWRTYVSYGMMDADTKIANVKVFMTLGQNYNGLYTPDFYTFSMLFVEPDPLGKCPNRAWLINNMFPKSMPEVVGSRDMKAAGEMKEISMEFSALGCPPNVALNTMAERLLAAMNSLKKIPAQDFVLPITDINSSVAAADTGIDS